MLRILMQQYNITCAVFFNSQRKTNAMRVKTIGLEDMVNRLFSIVLICQMGADLNDTYTFE